MYNILVHAHSGLRWVVLLLLVFMIINAGSAMAAKRPANRKLSAITMGLVHLQILIGLVLYFLSPRVQFSDSTMSNPMLRFYTVEHVLGMLIVAVLVTIGNRKAKAGNASATFWYYLIALIVIFASIPWPFRGLGNDWF